MNLRQYQEINNSFNKRLIFHFGQKAGFYSEFNNMVLGIAYCLTHNIKFEMYSKDANFCIENGWLDYFLPFCKESKNPFHKILNRRTKTFAFTKNKIFSHIYNFSAEIFKIFYQLDYLTQDLFLEFRDRKLENQKFVLNEFNISGDIKFICKEIIGMIWKPNPDTDFLIQNLKNNLNLPGKYISMHIRRGDKYIEAPLLEIEKYMNVAIESSISKNVFVSTDNYRIYQQLVIKYPDWNFFTLTQPNERGYFQKKFKSLPNQEKYLNIIRLFASIDIMTNSELFIGTFSSNIGMFLGIMMESDKTIGLDLPEWQIF